MEKKAKPFRKTLWILGALAIFTVVSVIYNYFSTLRFMSQAVETKGVVVGFEKQRKSFQPKVKFETKEGQAVIFLASLASKDTTQVKTGSPVKVLYHPEKPQMATLGSFWEIWGPAIFSLIFGVGPFLFVWMLSAILIPKQNT